MISNLPLSVLSEDPYCLEVKVAVEDSENKASQGECVYVCFSRDHHVTTTVCVDVRFQLPPTYPDKVPEITITTGSGLEAGEMRELERQLTQQVRL